MALRIVNNIAALNTQRWLSVSDAGMKKSLERLSSGYRINRAADDAAGLAISQSFRANIASFKVASRNTSEAASLLQVGEGAMDQIGNMLTRLKELATQAASANAGTELGKIDAEKAELILEIDRISGVTEYAGTKLIDGSFGNAPFEWGTEATDLSTDIDTVNGNKYVYASGGASTPTVSFTFSNSVSDIADAGAYTLTTNGATASIDGMTLVGASSTYAGTYDADSDALLFNSIGLTISGASTLTTTNLVADTITVSDVGFGDMTVATTATTGTWSVTDAGNNITLTNDVTSEAQIVSTIDNDTQTLDFDDLGIMLYLNAGYSTGELNGLDVTIDEGGSSTFQVGSGNTVNDRVSISLGDATASGLGISNLTLATVAGAQSALDTISSAISALATVRGNIGAAQNRLGYAAANLATTIENVQAAESVIRDVDMAAEMTDFTKNQILLQAGTAMLAQANMAPQQVLALFG